MERIRLNKREKRVLRYLHRSQYDNIGEFDYSAMKYLEELGLIKVVWAEGEVAGGAKITLKGKEYFNQYPHLGNPIDWTKVAAIGAWIAAVASIAALFIACTKDASNFFFL